MTTRMGLCIPAAGDGEGLRALLESIERLDLDGIELHVVVAVDGPDESLERVARAFGVQTVVLAENRGPAAARNAAVDALRSRSDVDIVWFTDAGCRVDRQAAGAHVRALRHADLSGGEIRFTLPPKPSPAAFVDSIRHLRQRVYVERDGYAATANLAVRSAVLEGFRFDERFRLPGGEDVDFCHRATALGFSLTYAPHAIVEHPPRDTTRALFAKVRRTTATMPLQADRWRARELPPLRFSLHPWFMARRAHGVSPWWGLYACALDFGANVMIYRAAARVRRGKGQTYNTPALKLPVT